MIVLFGDISAERHPAESGFEGFELEGFCDGISLRIEFPSGKAPEGVVSVGLG